MSRYTDHPLVSRQVSMRQQERAKKINQQQSEMNTRMVERETNAFNQSLAAAEDKYMRGALNQVRQSDVTLPETLTRFQGTWAWNMK